jgi:hypothetical protein
MPHERSGDFLFASAGPLDLPGEHHPRSAGGTRLPLLQHENVRLHLFHHLIRPARNAADGEDFHPNSSREARHTQSIY